jgi:HSP20 family molecular chaperone IbpA
MKRIDVSPVDSISSELEQVHNRIRLRAYYNFLERAGDLRNELDDWLDAEREVMCILASTIRQEEKRIVAQIEVPKGRPELLEIYASSQDLFVHAEIQNESSPVLTDNNSIRSAFGVIRFPATIDPALVRAEYSEGILRITAPLSKGANSLRRTA